MFSLVRAFSLPWLVKSTGLQYRLNSTCRIMVPVPSWSAGLHLFVDGLRSRLLTCDVAWCYYLLLVLTLLDFGANNELLVINSTSNFHTRNQRIITNFLVSKVPDIIGPFLNGSSKLLKIPSSSSRFKRLLSCGCFQRISRCHIIIVCTSRGIFLVFCFILNL